MGDIYVVTGSTADGHEVLGAYGSWRKAMEGLRYEATCLWGPEQQDHVTIEVLVPKRCAMAHCSNDDECQSLTVTALYLH